MAETTPQAPGGGRSKPASSHAAVPNLFTGLPPLFLLSLGVVIGAAVSFAVGVVIWSVFA